MYVDRESLAEKRLSQTFSASNIGVMKPNNLSKELLQNGSALISMNGYQMFIFNPVYQFMRKLNRLQIPRNSTKGKFYWSLLSLMQSILSILSPRAYSIFWEIVESARIIDKVENKKIGLFGREFLITRKKYLNPSDLDMTLKDYAKYNQVKNSI